jgi:hypothetical protein
MKIIEFFMPCIVGFFIIMLILGLFFLWLTWDYSYKVPKDGVWYCDELQMQLSFSTQYNCSVVVDGKELQCILSMEIGSSQLRLLYHETGYHAYKHGDALFEGDSVSLSEDIYVVKDLDSGEIYSFHRIK